jgi:hypothetical protein
VINSTRERSILTRRLLAAVCAGSLALNVGCYSYAPIQNQPPAVASKASIRLNDTGRAQLADRVGAMTDRIEGRIVSSDSTSVRMTVSRVVDLRGNGSNWLGEEITVPKAAILDYQERPFSRGRTVALVAGLIGGFVLVALSISALAGGLGATEVTPEGGGSGQS